MCLIDIFKEFSILPVACLYIPEIVCYMKKYEESLEKYVQIHNYSMWKKLDLHADFCNADLFKEKHSEYRN